MTAKLQISPGQRFGKLVAIAVAPRSTLWRHPGAKLDYTPVLTTVPNAEDFRWAAGDLPT